MDAITFEKLAQARADEIMFEMLAEARAAELLKEAGALMDLARTKARNAILAGSLLTGIGTAGQAGKAALRMADDPMPRAVMSRVLKGTKELEGVSKGLQKQLISPAEATAARKEIAARIKAEIPTSLKLPPSGRPTPVDWR